MTSERNDHNDVEQLLALAGPRDVVPAERLERMRASVHDAWLAETATKPRSRRLALWTLVTAAVAAIIFAVVRTPPDAGIGKPAKALVDAEPIQFKTGPGERKSFSLPSGGEIRLDAWSLATLKEDGELHLTKGALYLDSKGTTLPNVITPAGRITDIGTRFEVRLIPGAAGQVNTRVRVRDGRIRFAQAGTLSEVAASEELMAGADGSTSRRHADPFGAGWAWVTRAAPRFELEGRSLGDFLDWIAKEGGWTIAFASPERERRARSTVLHGSIERMSTTEALDAILPACGLTHQVDLKTGRVTVAESPTR